MRNTVYKTIINRVDTSWLILASLLLALLISLNSCEEFLDVNTPVTETTTDNVFNTDATATSAMLGIYSLMFDQFSFSSEMTVVNGLAADEFINFRTGAWEQFFENSLLTDNSSVNSYWSNIYQIIYSANAVLEGLQGNGSVTDSLKNQFEGEAKLTRAFGNFYLTNLWGDVPLASSPDFRINSSLSRTSQSEVYTKIIDDLQEAEELLSDDYSYSEGDRSRPNKWAATALLSRVYLYMGDWLNAEAKASEVIGNGDYNLVSELNEVFLANSSEAIWQLSSTVTEGVNVFDVLFFIIDASPTQVALSDDLYDAFETSDNRRVNWVGSFTEGDKTWYFPFKYKVHPNDQAPITEYLMILRLAEQYLIRAEARAHLNNLSGAQDDLNIVRSRAGLENTNASNQSELLLAIEDERRIELFSEWGHRWLDLKRTGRADAVLAPIKTNWQSTDELYPVPMDELGDNPNLTQNPGY